MSLLLIMSKFISFFWEGEEKIIPLDGKSEINIDENLLFFENGKLLKCITGKYTINFCNNRVEKMEENK